MFWNGADLFLIASKLKNWREKAVDYYYPYALEYVSDCFMAQEMCENALDTYPSALMRISNCCKTQKMCKKAVSKELLR